MGPEEYYNHLLKYRIEPADTDPAKMNSHIPLLERLDLVDSSSVALFDFSVVGYTFLTKRFKFLLGYNPEEALGTGVQYFFPYMHSYDLNLFLDTSAASLDFLYSLPPEERKDYKTCQDFRIRTAGDSWIRLIQQLIVLELSRSGGIWLTLIINDISPVKDLDVPARRYMEHIPTGKRVLFAAADAEAKSPLSRRELEILGLAARGFPSRDIADFLGISVCTVNTHRQNILAKTDSSNTAEAIRFASDLNLL